MKEHHASCIWVIESKPAGAGSSWNICWGEGSTMVWPIRARARAYAKELEDYSEERDKFRAVCYVSKEH